LENTKEILYPDLKNSSIMLWSGYWLRNSQLHFLQERGVSLIKEINNKNKQKNENEKLNEETVNTFQFEFKNMTEEIKKLKSENLEWMNKWNNDTTSLLNLCEKQKIEINKWSNGDFLKFEKNDKSSNEEKKLKSLEDELLKSKDEINTLNNIIKQLKLNNVKE
jgi:hypothetical protein